MLLGMRNILFLICVLSFFSAGLASAACAHIYDSSSLSLDQQVEININQDDSDNEGLSDPLCDMHCHNHISSTGTSQDNTLNISSTFLTLASDDVVTSPIFGLKRPPKI